MRVPHAHERWPAPLVDQYPIIASRHGGQPNHMLYICVTVDKIFFSCRNRAIFVGYIAREARTGPAEPSAHSGVASWSMVRIVGWVFPSIDRISDVRMA